MYDKQYFINSFKELGLKRTDTVFVHSSYKKIAGEEGVEGGADTIIDAFIEYFGQEGLVVFPALTWKLGYMINKKWELRPSSMGPAEGFKDQGTHFDVKNTPCHDLGIIPEIFRKRPGVVRSICPTSSVAAFGPDAEEFCAGHESAQTAFQWSSPWGKLYARKAKILFLGTTMGCNTFMHVIEEYAEVPGLISPLDWNYTVTDADGKEFAVTIKRHFPGHNRYYNKIEPELVEQEIAKRVMFASAPSHIVDAVAETDYMLQKLKENPQLFFPEYNEKQ